MSNNNVMTLEEMLEVGTLYEGCSSKEELYEIMNRYPCLRDQFSEQITEAFSDLVRDKGIYFIVNKISWKRPVEKESLYLGSLGFNRHPKMSVYI